MELQEGVESVDVRVPLFIKDEDDDKKQLLVEAIDVPEGIATIGKRYVNITVIKEHGETRWSASSRTPEKILQWNLCFFNGFFVDLCFSVRSEETFLVTVFKCRFVKCLLVCVCVCAAKSILTFLQPSYTFARQDGVANIPISRDIIEDGRTQVTYSTRDLTAKDKKVRSRFRFMYLNLMYSVIVV